MSRFAVLLDRATDSAFRTKLLDDPPAAAAAAGVAIPAGVTLKLVEDTATRLNLVIGGITDDTPDETAALLAKAKSNPEFKARLIADPKGTAQMESGVLLPDDFELVVHENTPTTVYVVLPPTESAAGELSAMDMESMAGGISRPSKRSGIRGSAP